MSDAMKELAERAIREPRLRWDSYRMRSNLVALANKHRDTAATLATAYLALLSRHERMCEAGERGPVSAVWLRKTDEDHAEVLVEVDGQWRSIIKECLPSNFSHIAESVAWNAVTGEGKP